ncbi:MAG: HlyD family efflux transporter periplasmic adaptor subunit [Eubacteriales bacterium]|nr:HlyD family efflux transporter periplasmic adaptor subunit [Eubacteriales bacterium]
MKRKQLLALALCVLLPACALAEDAGADSLMVSAKVVSGGDVALAAPMSGLLAPFTVRAGDQLAAGDTLFSVEPQKLYADINGTVADVFVQPGDSADAAASRYGSALVIERESRWELQCNLATGYNNDDNRDPRVGWPVWLRSSNEKRFADGRIIAVSGRSMTVEIIGGDLQYGDDVKVYRTSDYANRSFMARASISAVPPEQVSVSGTVLSVEVRKGDAVQKGDLLLTYAPEVLTDLDSTVKADSDMIVTSVSAAQGASVQKDQPLLLACRVSELELEAQVEEGDLARVQTGARALVTFDNLAMEPIEATVRSVSALGSEEETSRFAVRLSFAVPEGVRLGMHASVEIR